MGASSYTAATLPVAAGDYPERRDAMDLIGKPALSATHEPIDHVCTDAFAFQPLRLQYPALASLGEKVAKA